MAEDLGERTILCDCEDDSEMLSVSRLRKFLLSPQSLVYRQESLAMGRERTAVMACSFVWLVPVPSPSDFYYGMVTLSFTWPTKQNRSRACSPSDNIQLSVRMNSRLRVWYENSNAEMLISFGNSVK
ncbi:unnamed protein product [Bubo scandiacus]